jgi:hypothetical protein
LRIDLRLHGRSSLGGVLEFRPQPAHEAACFFGGALGVERHQTGEQFLLGFRLIGGFVGQGRCRAGPAHQHGGQIAPAVGGEDRSVELVVQFTQHRGQTHLVDRALLGGQRVTRTQLLDHVVEARQRELGLRSLLALAGERR